MSTRGTLVYRPPFHLYHECIDGSVRLECEIGVRTLFNVRIPFLKGSYPMNRLTLFVLRLLAPLDIDWRKQ